LTIAAAIVAWRNGFLVKKETFNTDLPFDEQLY
jgi:hypothetical protein